MNLDTAEHLKNNSYYIITGIYNTSDARLNEIYFKNRKEKELFIDPKEFTNELKEKWYIWKLKSETTFVDYFLEKDKRDEIFFAHWGGFVLSKIWTCPLYSNAYRDCIWVVAIWKDKETWKNISFLTHQWLEYIKSTELNRDWIRKNKLFKNWFSKLLQKFKQQCEEWTVDIVILWGRNDADFQEYKEWLHITSKIIEENLWINPSVAWWPSIKFSTYTWDKAVLVDTKNRRILFFKEYNHPSENIDFVVNETEEKLENLIWYSRKYLINPGEIIKNNLPKNLVKFYKDEFKKVILEAAHKLKLWWIKRIKFKYKEHVLELELFFHKWWSIWCRRIKSSS